MTTSMSKLSTEVDPDLTAMMEAVFADHRRAHSRSAAVTRDADLWQALDELGLVRLTAPETEGGSGAGWAESAELLAAAVRNGVRIPLAEHDLLACWLLRSAGLPVDAAPRTVCVLDDAATARDVPWAVGADRIVVVWRSGTQHLVADADPAALTINPGANAIGEPRDTVVADIDTLSGTPIGEHLLARLWLKSALVRSIQVCAALDAILQSSIEHVTSRHQFGRPLSKFQAIQNLIADIASEAALARAATEAALSAAIASDWTAAELDFLVAVARSCTGHAASVVVRNAHQVHGAIGTTLEHRLHEFTRSALTWRSEFGSVRHWDDAVTEMAVRAGSARLWHLITG